MAGYQTTCLCIPLKTCNKATEYIYNRISSDIYYCWCKIVFINSHDVQVLKLKWNPGLLIFGLLLKLILNAAFP